MPFWHRQCFHIKKKREMTLYIGIDGGGSHCRALLQDSKGKILGEGWGGPANPVNGAELAKQSILEACNQALSNAGMDSDSISQCSVGAGLSGLHLPYIYDVMNAWNHPFEFLSLTTDLHAAVAGAHQGKDGGVLILGTGFSAMAIKNKKQFALGGMGFPINAKASGSWLGLEAIKAVILAEDELGPDTLLTRLILNKKSAIELAQQTVNAGASVFAKYAPFVFEAADKGDTVANELINEASDFAAHVIARMINFGVANIALVGSVAHALYPRLPQHLKQHIISQHGSPQAGAILLLQQAILNKHSAQKDPQ
ncbi:BadF/BadG/BcrA/BcrD type ATPase [Alteromonas macleodii str. 'Balearic Sea AD45']|nr:BadF/BadG/BcrA/BcrD type ATPase [Alteromonas macleodii str. 'Balearic Sea AD45']